MTLEHIREEVAELLEVPAAEIDPEDNLVDHGLDSIRLMQLVQRWQAQGVAVDFPALAERPQLTYWLSLAGRTPGASRG
jgi:aryl carrier-like protein